MPASRVTYPAKTNDPSDPDIINKYFATEANEVKAVANDHADRIDNIEANLIVSSNPFYGRYTSLALLQAAHPMGEVNAWAVIDAGAGITPLIAIWDNIGGDWEIAGFVDTTVEVANYAALPAPGTSGFWYVTLNTNYLYRWYNGQYNLVGVPATHEVKIQGALVEIEGKTDLSVFEVDDKFRYWDGDNYVTGKIVDDTAIIPDDLYSGTKIKLAVNAGVEL